MKLKNLVSICLLAMAATANAVWAQVQAAPPTFRRYRGCPVIYGQFARGYD